MLADWYRCVADRWQHCPCLLTRIKIWCLLNAHVRSRFYPRISRRLNIHILIHVRIRAKQHLMSLNNYHIFHQNIHLLSCHNENKRKEIRYMQKCYTFQRVTQAIKHSHLFQRDKGVLSTRAHKLDRYLPKRNTVQHTHWYVSIHVTYLTFWPMPNYDPSMTGWSPLESSLPCLTMLWYILRMCAVESILAHHATYHFILISHENSRFIFYRPNKYYLFANDSQLSSLAERYHSAIIIIVSFTIHSAHMRRVEISFIRRWYRFHFDPFVPIITSFSETAKSSGTPTSVARYS